MVTGNSDLGTTKSRLFFFLFRNPFLKIFCLCQVWILNFSFKIQSFWTTFSVLRNICSLFLYLVLLYLKRPIIQIVFVSFCVGSVYYTKDAHNRIFVIKQSSCLNLPPKLSKQQFVLLWAEPSDLLQTHLK